MKKLLPLLIALTLVLGMMPSFAATPAAGIVIDGTRVVSDVAPLNRNGSLLVPVRVIENLGALITYDGATRKVTVNSAAKVIVLSIGSKTALVNGVPKTMQAADEMLKAINNLRN